MQGWEWRKAGAFRVLPQSGGPGFFLVRGPQACRLSIGDRSAGSQVTREWAAVGTCPATQWTEGLGSCGHAKHGGPGQEPFAEPGLDPPLARPLPPPPSPLSPPAPRPMSWPRRRWDQLGKFPTGTLRPGGPPQPSGTCPPTPTPPGRKRVRGGRAGRARGFSLGLSFPTGSTGAREGPATRAVWLRFLGLRCCWSEG